MTAPAGDRATSLVSVLHLRDSERLCGPGKIIRDCIRANPDPEISFRVAAFESSGKNEFLEALSAVVRVIGVPGQRARLGEAVRVLAQVIRTQRVDLLHTHDAKANAIGLVTARWTGIPIVATVHGRIRNSFKGRLYAALDDLLLRRMDLVFAVSALMARQLDSRGVRRDRLVVARNGIMLSEYGFGMRSTRLREEGLLHAGDVVIGHVGRISPEKGVVELLDAFKAVAGEFPSSRLVVAGDGPDFQRVQRAAAAPELRGRVILLGYREDIESVYGALDLFVLNSKTEGLPNAVLEAMAYGVPVLATAVGGTPELVHDGDTGLLIPPSEPTVLAAAIRTILCDRDAAVERARRARSLVEREFDVRQLSRSIARAYRGSLALRHQGMTPR